MIGRDAVCSHLAITQGDFAAIAAGKLDSPWPVYEALVDLVAHEHGRLIDRLQEQRNRPGS